MADTLEAWLASGESVPGVVARWAPTLVELGASWETFRCDGDATLDDLVDGGIPRLAARDVCRAMRGVLRRRSRPLLVLWDIENVGIPARTSASDAVARIKEAVAPHGEIRQFRAYADIGRGDIPERKRSELHLSGCNLVDSTHSGRKEVADKMIIVDSMEFAYAHPEGAALCFITGDVDYAYLLSKLDKPQWTTIVISMGSGPTMLHANCSVRLRWETDVLRLPASQIVAQHQPPNDKVWDASGPAEGSKLDGFPREISPSPPALPFTQSDKTLLHAIIKEGSNVGDDSPGTLKSYIGASLKARQPQRFADRAVVKSFLAQAIDMGVVFESGEGANKSLHASAAAASAAARRGAKRRPATELHLNVDDIPERVLEVSKTLPFLVVVEKWHMPKGSDAKGFVQPAGNYLVLMFKTAEDAQQAEIELQYKGIFIHRRDLLALVSTNDKEEENIVALIAKHGKVSLSQLKRMYKESYGVDIMTTRSLRDYIATFRKIQIQRCDESNDTVAYLRPPPGMGPSSLDAVRGKSVKCSSVTPIPELTAEEKGDAQERVFSVISMLAEYDDILPSRSIVRKLLVEKFPSCCASRDQAGLWINHSIEVGIIIEIKHYLKKQNKVLVLPKYKHFADAPYPEIDTSEAESFVTNLLWEEGGLMDRKAVNDALVEKFAHMSNPMMRGLVARNGMLNKAFSIAKGAHGQVVGLSYDDAMIALEACQDKLLPSKEELPLSDEESPSVFELRKENESDKEGSIWSEDEISVTKEKVD